MAKRSKPSKSEQQAEADAKYLSTGLMLCAGSVGLGVLTWLIWFFTSSIYIIVPIGAAVLLLIGSGSIMRWFFGDKMNWD